MGIGTSAAAATTKPIIIAATEATAAAAAPPLPPRTKLVATARTRTGRTAQMISYLLPSSRHHIMAMALGEVVLGQLRGEALEMLAAHH